MKIKPWCDCPSGPCGCGGIGCLTPYGGEGRFYGPADSTLFCPACGKGWVATDDEIEQALIAEVWWDAFQESGKSEQNFLRSQRVRAPRPRRVNRAQMELLVGAT